MKQSLKLKNKPKLEHVFSFDAIGTKWWIGLYQKSNDSMVTDIKNKILKRIEVFDFNYSRFREDSLISSISKRAGTFDIPEDGERLLRFYEKLYAASDGLVTPLIGQSLADAGYDSTYSLKPNKTITKVPGWHEIMEYSDGKLSTKKPVLLDLGAAGKGYLVDIVAEIIDSFGMTDYCVDASGDMLYRNTENNLRVGLEDPADSSMAIGVANINNQSICGSASNRRRWGKYSHIMDPHSLESASDIAATWVVADTGLEADGLATALFFTEPAKLALEFDYAFVRLFTSGEAEVSANFDGELFGEDI
jgi:thiamine biosynthesis lipoprotein